MDENKSGQASAATPESSAGARPSDWYLAIVLMLAALLSSIDRTTLSLIIGPIKREFGISDLKASVLLGLSFSLFYGAFTIVAGHLADRVSRRKLLAGGILIWSLMEIACGTARSYMQLLLPRMGLGIGEGTLQPSAFSMIRDAFPLRQRSRAFSLLQLGPYMGSGVSLILGGTLLQWAQRGAFSGVAFAAGLAPWHWVLIITGVIGVPVAFLILTTREPARKDASGATGSTTTGSTTLRATLSYLASNWRLQLPLWTAMTLYGMAIGAQSSWLPEAVARAWHVPLPRIGHVLGLTGFILAPIGLLTSGRIADHLASTRGPAAVPRLAMFATAGAALATMIFPFVGLFGAYVAYVCQTLLFSGFAVWGATTLTVVSPGNQLGKLTGFYYLVQVVLGLGMGPAVAAFVATAFHTGPNAIGYAIVETFTVCVLLGAVLMGWVGYEINRSAREGTGAVQTALPVSRASRMGNPAR
jgi:MFS family permease